MNRRAILLVCVVLSAAGSLATRDFELFETNHLDWTILTTDYTQNSENRETLDALLSIQAKSSDSREDILAKIKAAREQCSPISHKYYVYGKLISLADPDDESCPSTLIELALEITLLLSRYESLESFARFLIRYGGQKFGICRWNAMRDIALGSEDNKQSEEQLDRFFAALAGVEEADPTDDRMFKAVRFLYLEHEKFKAKQGLKVARESSPSSGDSLRDFCSFLARECSGMKKGLEDAMNIIALAEAFNSLSPTYYSNRVLKLQEYNRLCLSLQRLDMREAANNNLKKQLGITEKKKKTCWGYFVSTPSRETRKSGEPIAGSSADAETAPLLHNMH